MVRVSAELARVSGELVRLSAELGHRENREG